MSRRLRIGLAISALVGAQAGLIAWAAADSTTASDGGNSVTVGAASGSSIPGEPDHHGGGKSGSSGSSCTYTPMPAKQAATFGPGGPTPGAWYFVHCPGKELSIYNGALSWFPSGSAPGATTPAVSPSAVVRQAVSSLNLPSPIVGLNPSSFSLVNLRTWLWVDPRAWHSLSATAAAGGVSATAVVIPQTVSWSMGDGHTVVCGGPGTPYQSTVSSDAQSTDCAYTYRISSAGQPSSDGDANHGAFVVTATITWTVTWSATGVAGGGSLPPLHTSSTVPVRVEQVESVGTAG